MRAKGAQCTAPFCWSPAKMHPLCPQPPTLPPLACAAMISCDGCGDWFHSRCVGLSQSQMRGQRRFTCPICIAIKARSGCACCGLLCLLCCAWCTGKQDRAAAKGPADLSRHVFAHSSLPGQRGSFGMIMRSQAAQCSWSQHLHVCPLPRLLQGNTDPLESCIAKLQRTKRPERDELAALLPDLQV